MRLTPFASCIGIGIAIISSVGASATPNNGAPPPTVGPGVVYVPSPIGVPNLVPSGPAPAAYAPSAPNRRRADGGQSSPNAEKSPLPNDFPATFPPALMQLKEQATQAHLAVEAALVSAKNDLGGDAAYESLLAGMKAAEDRVENARSSDPDDLPNAAAEKMQVASELRLYMDKMVSSKSVVIAAKQNAADADRAVGDWIHNHDYTSIAEMIEMVPELDWLRTLDTYPGKYIFPDQFFDRINQKLDAAVNGHKATITIKVAGTSDNSAVSAALGLPPTFKVYGEAADLGYLHVVPTALFPSENSKQLGPFIGVEGTLNVRISPQRAGNDSFQLDVSLYDCRITAVKRELGTADRSDLPVAAKPTKIVFVCDGSGSMLTKMDLQKQLIEGYVQQLQPSQSFDVLFFQDSPANSSSCLAMAPNLLTATDSNKGKLELFLQNIVAQSTTHVIPALTAAFRLPTRPDLIYLMTDGGFEDETAPVVIEAIRRLNSGKRAKINTILLLGNNIDPDELRGASTAMKTIAEQNGGTYSPVSIEMLER